jgi:putative acetyltransferase
MQTGDDVSARDRNWAVRPECPADIPAIHSVLTAAFPTDLEARLVELLRARGRLTRSLVASDGMAIVGHIAFSPVSLSSGRLQGRIEGLAPVSVRPEAQGKGAGSALIRAGLAALRQTACTHVVVLGEPEYYGRFGFRRAADYGLANEYDADDAFQVLSLYDEPITRFDATACYAPEFAEVLSTG